MLHEVFSCDRCGLCCRLIGKVPQLRQFDRGDGVCCHLTDENLCDIYEDRPEVCSVEKMYSRFSDQMGEREYISFMNKSCDYLKAHFDEMQVAAQSKGLMDDSCREKIETDFLKLKGSMSADAFTRILREVGCDEAVQD